MKLQLSPTQVGDFVLKVGSKTVRPDPLEALREDVARTLASFRAEGHDPLTRKDVAAVLVGLGYDSAWVEKDSAAYQAITNVLSAQCSPTLDVNGQPLRGFYSQNKGGGASAPSKSPPAATPTPSAAAIPEPTVDEEIRVNVIPVAGLSLADIGIGVSSFTQSKAVMDAASLYEQDLGLRRLAVAASPCYGTGFDETETACQECPLASRCAKQSISFLGSVASDLDQATERSINTAVETERRRLAEQKAREAEKKRQEAAAAAAKNNPSPIPSPAAPPPSAAPVIPPGGKMTVEQAQQALAAKYPGKGLSAISIPFEGICSKCGEKIARHALGVHLDATVVKSGKPGMWHIECALA